MLKHVVFKAAALLTLLVLLITSVLLAQDITLLVNPDYKPYSYEEDGELKGLMVDVFHMLAERTGLDVRTTRMPFDQAYSTLQGEGAHALSTLVFTVKRSPLFQWVGPLEISETSLYGLSDVFGKPLSFDDARSLEKVGVVKEFYSHQLLVELGFENLVVYQSESALLNGLISGDVDLAPFNAVVLENLLEGLEHSVNLTPAVAIDLDMIYIGLSMDVPADKVEALQRALDELKHSGVFAELYNKWLPDHSAPGVYTFLTEEYPPITFMGDGGKPSGFVVDIVRELMARSDVSEEIYLVPWTTGYNLALNLPNIFLFSIDRTPHREPLFEWIGPVGKNTAYLYAKAGSAIDLTDIESAKGVPAIATIEAWWTEQLLKELGFTNLVGFPNPLDAVHQLISGRAQLSVFTDLTVASLVKDAGYSMDDLERLVELQSNNFYIAASKGTDQHIVLRFHKMLDQMKRDGLFEEIVRKYIPHMLVSSLIWESTTPRITGLHWMKNVLKQGELVNVTLEENASTGYMWDVTISNPNVLSIVYKGEVLDPGSVGERDLVVGAPYEVEWIFQAENPGETVVVFSLRRPWESSHPIETFAVNVTVE